MLKRSRRRNVTDVNLIASEILAKATSADSEPRPEKNPAAVALGRLGGLKGGPARAMKLSRFKRRQIAKRAATARWSGSEKKQAK